MLVAVTAHSLAAARRRRSRRDRRWRVASQRDNRDVGRPKCVTDAGLHPGGGAIVAVIAAAAPRDRISGVLVDGIPGTVRAAAW
jgi:hypothetical protein